MKKFLFYNLFVFLSLTSIGQTSSIKNVIVMIPDGVSTSLLSAARWYQYQMDSTRSTLYIDPYVRGLVRTHSSDAPIGDSAPTTSCYMTGQLSQTGFIATYPVHTDHDLVPVDATRAYQPLATLLEAAKQMQHKSTGLVFTCEFPHATPADCAAHTYNRSDYGMIAPQMVYNKVDVLIGGGTACLNESEKMFLAEHGYRVLFDDYAQMRNCRRGPMWALFDPYSMPYEMERDPVTTPSLAEMTQKAIELLSQNPNGFFLMVEGSKVDWAAHDNDAKAAITDFLAFDEACGIAFDFARKNGETVVMVIPDHGTGALTIGNTRSNHDYDRLSLAQLMQPLDSFKLSTWTMSEKMKTVETSAWPALFKQYYHVSLSPADINFLQSARDYQKSTLPTTDKKHHESLSKLLGQFLYAKTYFGFTTFGHTAENVFMAVYHPEEDVLYGCPTNVQVNDYLCRQMNLTDSLPKLTDRIYADHHRVFANCEEVRIDSLAPYQYRLWVKNGKNTLTADSYTDYVTVNKKKIELSSVMVYMPINKTFYLPKQLSQYLEKSNSKK